METLPKDMIEYMTNQLSPPDLILFCASEVRPNVKQICDDNDFWIRRWNKDFEYLKYEIPNYLQNPKQSYLALFSKISEGAEELSDLFLKLNTNLLTIDNKKQLYNYFFQHISKILPSIFSELEGMKPKNLAEWYIEFATDIDEMDNFKNSFPTLTNINNKIILNVISLPLSKIILKIYKSYY